MRTIIIFFSNDNWNFWLGNFKKKKDLWQKITKIGVCAPPKEKKRTNGVRVKEREKTVSTTWLYNIPRALQPSKGHVRVRYNTFGDILFVCPSCVFVCVRIFCPCVLISKKKKKEKSRVANL